MRHLHAARWSLAALAIVAVAACAGEDDGSGGAVPPDASSTSSPSSPSISASTTTPGAVPEASVEPAVVVPQSAWLTASVDIPYPDAMAALGDSVFVKTDDGHVVQIRAASAKVVADVRVDTSSSAGRYCLGIGSDGRTLWACSAGDETTDVVRLTPGAPSVSARVPVDKVFDQLALPVVAGRVWTLTGAGDRLTAIDTDTAETTTTPLKRRCFQLAATKETVYATCLVTDEVIAVDVATGQVTATADVLHPINISVSGDDVWVSGGRGLLRMSPDLQPLVLFPGLTAGAEGDLVATADAVWVRQAEGFLLRIDPVTDTVAAQYAVDPVPSGGSVLVTDDAIWVSASDDNLVYRLDPTAG